MVCGEIHIGSVRNLRDTNKVLNALTTVSGRKQYKSLGMCCDGRD